MWNRRCAEVMHRAVTRATTRRSGQLRILIVREGQSCPTALSIRRAPVRIGFLLTLAGVIGLGFLVSDWVLLRRGFLDSATFVERLGEQEEMNTRLRASLDKIRREMEAWPKLQAKIAEPFDRTPTPPPAATSVADDPDHALVAVRHGTATLREAAELMTRVREAVAPLPSTWPVRAAINSHFGRRRSPWTDEPEFHKGVDIAAAHGTEVVAPAPGSVVFSGMNGAYGLTVKVQHSAGVETLYGHLSKVSVRRGDRVTRGQEIGRAGNTGRSTGSHLHYEVIVAGRAVNPKAYLWD